MTDAMYDLLFLIANIGELIFRFGILLFIGLYYRYLTKGEKWKKY